MILRLVVGKKREMSREEKDKLISLVRENENLTVNSELDTDNLDLEFKHSDPQAVYQKLTELGYSIVHSKISFVDI